MIQIKYKCGEISIFGSDSLGKRVRCANCGEVHRISVSIAKDAIVKKERPKAGEQEQKSHEEAVQELEEALEKEELTGKTLSHPRTATKLQDDSLGHKPKKWLIAGCASVALLIGWACVHASLPRLLNTNTGHTFVAKLMSPPEKIKYWGQIEGGVWLTKGNGSSDILRGIRVYLCRDSLPLSDISDELAELARDLEEQAREENKEAAELHSTSAKFCQDLLALPDYSMVSLQEINELILAKMTLPLIGNYVTCQRLGKQKMLNKAITLTLVASTTTGIEGKFEFKPVPNGRYVLYAVHKDKFSAVEWMVPVEIEKKQLVVKVNLYNDNAARIANKEL